MVLPIPLLSSEMSKSLIPIVLFVYYFVNLHVKDEVEARMHDMVPLRGGWFGDVDTGQKEEEVMMTPLPNNEAYAEFPNIKRRKLKTKEKIIKVAEEEAEQPREVVKKQRKKKNKRRRKKKTVPRKFVKTTLGERDKDSNLTDSKEVEKKSKPVDIIVHIKMSE
ncbi:uncharacterized protein [Epargyreus clarus]|uniref:uncharacterized protein n=1 Tax=Epargyreus clarus TaxID=520877 RepID=UPI003C2CE62F